MDFDPLKPLVQEIFIKIDPKISSLSSRDKTKLIDSIGNSNGAKGLMVDFDFSHTGRRINRRVYSKIGHMRVANDLFKPYPKPITVDHTGLAASTIGRIVHATYIDMLEEAKLFFKKRRINENTLAQLDSALYTLDYEKAVDAFHKSKVLLNNDWKGIGRIAAKSKITDPEAIIKFIDQRYLTFSAEQETDAYVCSICLSDWKYTGICEHIPGNVYDNRLAFMLCGNMSGEGSSVVANPADLDSIVTNISLSDEREETAIEVMSKMLDTTIVNSNISIEDEKMNLLNKFLNGEELSKDDGYDLYKEIFADSAVSQEDYNLYPEAIKVNGILPIFDAATSKIVMSAIDNFKDELLDSTVKDLLVKRSQLFVDEVAVVNSEINLLDFLEKEETVATLNQERFKNLIEKYAKQFNLISEVKISDAELEILNTKIVSLETQVKENEGKDGLLLREKEKNKLLSLEYKNLVKDHLAVLKNLEDSLEENKLLLDKVSPVLAILKPDVNLNEKTFDNFSKILDTVNTLALESKLNDGITNTVIKVENDPTLASISKLDNLTDYEKKVVANYKRLIDLEGKASANKYFTKVKTYCSKDFHPTNFLE